MCVGSREKDDYFIPACADPRGCLRPQSSFAHAKETMTSCSCRAGAERHAVVVVPVGVVVALGLFVFVVKKVPVGVCFLVVVKLLAHALFEEVCNKQKDEDSPTKQHENAHTVVE